ncbi:MAG: U3 snoRNP protein [Bogoriella megaspora]|nr:MAG: U3 snoRNP protein [Bogoriella megaspora]
MAVGPRGRGAKPANKIIKAKKKSTPSSRQHPFESFSQRIAKTKIDPIHRARRYDFEEKDDTSESYFRAQLLEWQEKNLTETFTRFLRDVLPFCESLPQILHHQDRILDVLVTYIEKEDELSLEPLLDLVSHLAHDLGPRFELHFARTAATISKLAATNSDMGVIEWCFNCLAFLFKYLQRLLVPDLRPVFDLIAPLLGKESQKPYIARFATEALSFLVRRAVHVYPRDSVPLDIVVQHALQDIMMSHDEGDVTLYSQALMNLFSEAMKGEQNGLHSTAPVVLRTLARQIVGLSRPDDEFSYPVHEILLGALTAVSHHTKDESFHMMLDVLLDELGDNGRFDARRMSLVADVLFVALSTRRQAKSVKWPVIMSVIEKMFGHFDSNEPESGDLKQKAISAFAYALSFCPLNELIPYLRLLDVCSSAAWEDYFLFFCVLTAELDYQRFQDMVYRHFQKHGSEQAGLLYQCNKVLDIVGSTTLSDFKGQPNLAVPLTCLLKEALSVNAQQTISEKNALALGKGLNLLVCGDSLLKHVDPLWNQVCAQSNHFTHVPGFMHAIKSYLGRLQTKNTLKLGPDKVQPLFNAIIRCLLSPSHDLRLDGLNILHALFANHDSAGSALLSTALAIEEAPFNVETLRAASMHIRKLASGYQSISSDQWLQKAIPAYCLGLLHVRLTPLWEDVCRALEEIATFSGGEEAIGEFVTSWLQEDSNAVGENAVTKTIEPAHSDGRQPLSDFEDPETMRLERLIKECQELLDSSSERLREAFEVEHAPLPLRTPQCRTQALRVLNKIPIVAEKRSRIIVPVLLKWTSNEAAFDNDQQQWSRKNQKAMLNLFDKFVNPKVLYKGEEVYDALLALCCNGDLEIQKSALNAILTWKQPSIMRYKEHLQNLLEDTRFREELTVFFNVEQENSEIQKADWPELMPLLLRLLYGRVISRTKAATSGAGQQARRRAVFGVLARFEQAELDLFLDIVLDPIHNLDLVREGAFQDRQFDRDLVSLRKQKGLLTMLEDLLKELGLALEPFASRLIDAVIYCSVRAARLLLQASSDEESEEDSADDSTTFTSMPIAYQVATLKNIRKSGLHCLNLLFEHCSKAPWEQWMPTIFSELIDPRMEKLPIESAQSPSALLQTFAIWSSSLRYSPYLVTYNDGIIARLCEALTVDSAKDHVKTYILQNIIGKLINHAKPDVSASSKDATEKQVIRERILQLNANKILDSLATILHGSPTKELLDTTVQTIPTLGPYVTGANDARPLVDVSVFMLRQPSKRIQPHVKAGILEILEQFIPQVGFAHDEPLFELIYETVASLFGFFQDRAGQRPSRPLLCKVLDQLANVDNSLGEVSSLCLDLNSVSPSHLDQPDFERRSQAFRYVFEHAETFTSVRTWQPLIYNALFYIKEVDELPLRSNSSKLLCVFIEQAAKSCSATAPADSSSSAQYRKVLSDVLVPSIFRGVRDSPELVRSEYLSVLSAIIKTGLSDVNDMAPLLVGDDEEASFFTNILHIQQHRRLRALRRLTAEAGSLRAKNIIQLFLPLIEHFVFNAADDSSAHNLTAESITTIGALSRNLSWSQYRVTLERYLSYLTSESEDKQKTQKTVIRLLGVVIDALAPSKLDVSPNVIHDFITSTALSRFTQYLHLRDESTVSLRVPIAVAAVKLLRHLPPEDMSLLLPKVLSDLCPILRSRDQISRDMTRRTLAEISKLIGPSYFGFVLKELRSALRRGFELHVLSFTVHQMLLELVPSIRSGDLDYCVEDVVAILMDDIFGVTGQEKDAEDYISKMKEVKSSKSFNSMELIAKVTSPSCLSKLIQPIRALLCEKLKEKMVRKIDELLRRIGLGVSNNEAMQNRDILIFCYEIIMEAYKAQQRPDGLNALSNAKTKRYLVNMRGAAKSGDRVSTSSHVYKLVSFGLDSLRAVLQKHEELKTPANLAGFMPMINDALVGVQEEIQISAIRLLSAMIKVPLPEIDTEAPVYVGQVVRIIKTSPSTNTVISQAALKLASNILRERKSIEVKESDLSYLLEALLPDLDEPDRRGVSFNFLRAVLGRKIVINEVFKVMDEVRKIMITNHDLSIREAARGAYIQFFIEYPQGPRRLDKQIEFLSDGLEYEHAEGRRSVMETLHLLIVKMGDKPLQDFLSSLFMPLILRLHNDSDKECQEMLVALLRELFARADIKTTENFLSRLRSYLERDEHLLAKELSLRVWSIYLNEKHESAKDQSYIQEQLESIIVDNRARASDPEIIPVLRNALILAMSLCKSFPSTMLSKSSETMWGSIISLGSSSSSELQLPAARLVGLLFNDFARECSDTALVGVPLTGSGGIQLDGEGMIQVMLASLRTLQGNAMTNDPLMNQTIRNLVFLGRCFSANGMPWQPRSNQDKAGHSEIDDSDASEASYTGSVSQRRPAAIHYLITRLTRLIHRNEPLSSSTTPSPKHPALILLGALITHISTSTLTTSMQPVLAALNHLTDPTITRTSTSRPSHALPSNSSQNQHETLSNLAHEIMDKLKDKLGSNAFIYNMELVRTSVREKRAERKRKLVTERVREDGAQKVAERKRRKVESRKRREKEAKAEMGRGVVYRGKRRFYD